MWRCFQADILSSQPGASWPTLISWEAGCTNVKKKHSKNCEIMEMFSNRSRPIMASRFYCEKCVLPPKNIHASLLTLAIESHFFLERNVVLNTGPGAFSSES